MERDASLRVLGWGIYCASSWTWCIGMFLPIVMIDRFGWWGFFVFAVPNILGCAAFGYVLRGRDRSQQLINRHLGAMRGFSAATIAYHVFFIGFVCWLLLPLGEERLWLAVLAPVTMVSLAAVFSRLPTRAWPWFGAMVYVLSLLVFLRIGLTPLAEISWRGDQSLVTLAWLAPTIVIGFLLCPYFDLTFHRALQASGSAHTFGVFGITFAVMILLTCAYHGVLSNGLTAAVTAHLFAQSMFTVAAHTRELRAQSPDGNRSTRLLLGLSLLALPVAFLGAFTAEPLHASIDNYLRFLVFYGLVFPAYAIAFFGRHESQSPGRRGLRNFVIFILLAMPLYELGFINDYAWAVPIPLACLLAARVYDGWKRETPSRVSA